jgi:hypothetical protein
VTRGTPSGRRPPAAVRVTVAGVAAVSVIATMAVGLAAVAPAAADDPMQQAGRAAQQVAFSGRVRVEWVDANGSQATEMNVSSAQGEVEIDGPSILVATAHQRYTVGLNGWSLLAPGDPAVLGPVPPISRKYVVVQQPGPSLLGRPTDEVDLVGGGAIDERLYLDQATRLLLSRQQYDTQGNQIRKVSFVRLTLGRRTGLPLPSHSVDQQAKKIGSGWVPAPYVAPAALGEGYQRVGVLQAFGGIQVVYSDGLHGLSVFEQSGKVVPASLPANGQPVTIGARSGVGYVWPGGQVVVWRAGGSTYVVIGDAPPAELLAAIASLPAPRLPTVPQRLRRACRRLVQAVSGQW